MPDLPKGTPFDDMFDQFFRNHGQNGDAPRPHKSSSLGSGFVIDASGIIITNNHVVGDANDIMVIFTDGRKLKAEIDRQGSEGRRRGAARQERQAAQDREIRRQRQDAGRRRGDGGRQSVRAGRDGHGRHRFGA